VRCRCAGRTACGAPTVMIAVPAAPMNPPAEVIVRRLRTAHERGVLGRRAHKNATLNVLFEPLTNVHPWPINMTTMQPVLAVPLPIALPAIAPPPDAPPAAGALPTAAFPPPPPPAANVLPTPFETTQMQMQAIAATISTMNEQMGATNVATAQALTNLQSSLAAMQATHASLQATVDRQKEPIKLLATTMVKVAALALVSLAVATTISIARRRQRDKAAGAA